MNTAPRKNCEQIKKAGERAASLTRQLLAFSRQQVLEPRILNLNSVILDVEKMLSRVIGEDIELATLLDANLGFIKADKGQIEQVLMNLVVNARDAMPGGGQLTITTSNVNVDEVFARYHPPQQPGEYVCLSVRDTGIGMNAETQARIFEPFFTTKDVGRGTGLGLSTVYGVIRQSEGYVWVQSEPGQGTNFEIYLPLVRDSISEEKRSVSPPRPRRRPRRPFCWSRTRRRWRPTCDLLAGSGYKVLDAASPEEAIETATGYSGPIHLLLTDVVMPGMNGPSLAQKLAAIRPDIKVVYMSGYTGFRAWPGAGADAILLPKPFKRETLLRKLHDALMLNGQSRLGKRTRGPSAPRVRAGIHSKEGSCYWRRYSDENRIHEVRHVLPSKFREQPNPKREENRSWNTPFVPAPMRVYSQCEFPAPKSRGRISDVISHRS